MKVLIAVSCLLAVASAGYLGHPGVVAYAQHLPVIGPNGVPLEPAENVAARAEHAAAHIEAHARNGDGLLVAGHGLAYGAPLAYSHGAHIVAAPQHLPVIGPNGVPLEPAANVAARVQHAAAHVEAHARNGDGLLLAGHELAYAGHELAYAGHAGVAVASPLAYSHGAHIIAAPQHLPVIGPHGVPLEPAENVAARAAHAASHIEAKVRNGDVHLLARKRRGLIHAGGYLAAPQHLAVIGPNGVPLEPAANVAARAQHAAAHIEAHARNGDGLLVAGHGLGYAGHGLSYAGHAGVIASPLAYSHGAHIIAAPQHLPVIGPNGVPLEPAENVAARAHHAAAHIEAKARNGDIALVAGHGIVAPHYAHGIVAPVGHVSHAGGLPLDTVEVVAARAAHLATKAAITHGHIY